MRIYLQQHETGLYYEKNGSWVKNRNRAYNFKTSCRAMEFCLAEGLNAVDIVLSFADPTLDMQIFGPFGPHHVSRPTR